MLTYRSVEDIRENLEGGSVVVSTCCYPSKVHFSAFFIFTSHFMNLIVPISRIIAILFISVVFCKELSVCLIPPIHLCTLFKFGWFPSIETVTYNMVSHNHGMVSSMQI